MIEDRICFNVVTLLQFSKFKKINRLWYCFYFSFKMNQLTIFIPIQPSLQIVVVYHYVVILIDYNVDYCGY